MWLLLKPHGRERQLQSEPLSRAFLAKRSHTRVKEEPDAYAEDVQRREKATAEVVKFIDVVRMWARRINVLGQPSEGEIACDI